MKPQIHPPPFDRRWWYGLPLAILALMLVFEPTRLDFALADLFYVHGQGFIGRHNDFLEDILHDRAKQLSIAIGVLALCGFILSLLPTRLRPLRRRLGYLVLAMGLAGGFVSPLKKVTQMNCPWSLEQYGGVEHFSPLLGPRAAPVEKPGNCWPGGHAAAGFALIALFFVWRDSRPRLAGCALAFAIALGTLFSLVRMAQGAHFFSHNLWTALLCWLISLGLYDLMLFRPAQRQQQARQLLPLPAGK
ncbi:phosphoesterase [Pseudomonas alcaligenes]|uniref:Membrane protein n=2 Tax=Pseudomonadaceae TaxID=135621 RepID=A0A1V0LZZ0_ECTOL|nr:phosphatase PAP2 family protein [Pseudomonas alcaligenes]ARD68217.1 Membrane protein [Pseudomonas oleovorans]MBC9252075.1 phosphoesterase [Pseudomonas alcaligenes]